MLSILTDIKNCIIIFLLVVLLILSIAFIYEKQTKKIISGERDKLQQSLTLQNSQISQWKKESEENQKKLNEAQKEAHALKRKGEIDANRIMLEKVSPDCIQAKDWTIRQALLLRNSAQ